MEDFMGYRRLLLFHYMWFRCWTNDQVKKKDCGPNPGMKPWNETLV